MDAKAKSETEESEFIFSLDEIKKDLFGRISRFGRRLRNIGPMSNNEKIRRHYLKSVSTYRKRGVMISSYDSPGEIKRIVNSEAGVNIDKLTSVYEKARYGSEQCTDEEVKGI